VRLESLTTHYAQQLSITLHYKHLTSTEPTGLMGREYHYWNNQCR
jgi:hypothetical protein